MDISLYILLVIAGLVCMILGVYTGSIKSEDGAGRKIAIITLFLMLSITFLSVVAYQSLYVTQTICAYNTGTSSLSCLDYAHSYEPLAYLWAFVAAVCVILIFMYIGKTWLDGGKGAVA